MIAQRARFGAGTPRWLTRALVLAVSASFLVALPVEASAAPAVPAQAAGPGAAPQQRPVPKEALPFQGLPGAAAVPVEPAKMAAAGPASAPGAARRAAAAARQVAVAGGGVVALDGPTADIALLFARPGFVIGETSLIVYFNPDVVADQSWVRWQPVVTDVATGVQQLGQILDRDDPANRCGLPTLYCRALSTSGGFTLAPDRVYTVTIRVFLPAGAPLDSVPSEPSRARAVVDPPALPADQVAGCACPNVLTRAPGVQALRADLVNTGTGAYVRSARDAGVASFGLPFQATRLYASTKAHVGMFGPGWSWTYDVLVEPAAGGAVRVWAEDGSSAVFAPDGNGGYTRPLRVQSKLSRLGTGWRLSTADQRLLDFDAAGRLVKAANKRGLGVTLAYDAAGHLATATDAAGRVVKFVTGTDGQITRMTLADGRVVAYAYTAGLLTAVTDARGLVTRYGYDAGNRLATVTDPTGVVTARVVYGADGRVVSQADGVGSTVRFTFDAAQQIATSTDDDGVVTLDGYRKGLLVFSRNGQGNTLNVRYDVGLNANLSVDAVGNQTDVEHDAEGNVTQVRSPDPFGFVETNSYDPANNNLKKHKDTRGNDWRYDYNANNDMTGQADPEQAPEGAPGDVPATWNGYKYTYDDRGLVTTKTDPLGKVTRYEYDGQGNRTAEVAPTGRRTEFTYDPSSRLITMTDPRGTAAGADAATRAAYTTRITYDAEDRVIAQLQPGKKLPYVVTYDESGQAVTTVDPLLRTARWQRDAAGKVTTAIDAKGRPTRYGYTRAGRVESVTDPANQKTSWTYEARGRVATEISPRGNALPAGTPAATLALYTTTYEYDPAGNLKQSSRPFPPDPTKRVLVDGNFDQLNRPVRQVDELGGATEMRYDEAGNIRGMTDEKRRPLTYGYDKANHRINSLDADGRGGAAVEYDKAGNVKKQTSPNGGITTFEYDDDGRTIGITEPRGNVAGANKADYTTRYGFDPAGNPATVTDALGNVTTQVFDGVNRVVESVDPNGNTTRAIFDDADQPVAVFGPTSKGSAQDWLAGFKTAVASITSKGPVAGTVIAPGSVISPTSFALTTLAAFVGVPVTRYAFDATGQTVATADQLSRIRRVDYDAVDRPTAQIDPLGRVRRMTYDPDGNTVSMQSGSNTPEPLLSAAQKAALTTTMTYDPIGHLTQRKLGDGPTYTYGYDASGRLTSMGDPAGLTDIGYDETGLVEKVTRGTRVFGYTYDKDDNIKVRTYPDGTRVEANYDPGNRMMDLTTTRGVSSQKFVFEYDPADRLKRTIYPAGSGTVETLDYDRAGRMESVNATSGKGVRSGYALTRDPVGNPTRITTTRSDGGGAPTVAETTAYTFDASNRLTDACYGATGCGLLDRFADKYSYNYDLVGNRTKQVHTKTGGGPLGLPAITTTAYVYDAADQLKLETAIGADAKIVGYDYDGEGNQTQAGADRFAYNLDHTLASATSGGKTATFGYDASGSRLSATTGGQTRFWEWDTQNPLPMLAVESAAAGDASAGPAGGKAAPTTRAYTYGAGAQTLALHTGATDAAAGSTYTHDWLGGTANLLAPDGSAQWAYDYDPFGSPRGTGLTAGGRKLAATAPANPLQYTGAYNDEAATAGDPTSAAAGNYHLRARDYDPSTGRFTGTDPMPRGTGSTGISNYAYADDRATAVTDPSGMRIPDEDTQAAPVPTVGTAVSTDTPTDTTGNPVEPDYQTPLNELTAQQAAAQQSVNESESFTKQLGDEVVSLVMDLIGVTDAIACVRDGDIGACISTALNAVPWGKLFKAAKVAIKAIGIGKRLIEGYERLKSARAALAAITERVGAVRAAATAQAKKQAAEAAAAFAARRAAEARAIAQRAREAAARARQEAAKVAARAKAAKEAAVAKVRKAREAGCTGNSFAGDTRVLMADGTTKAIADIAPGDTVLAGPASSADEDTALAQPTADRSTSPDRQQPQPRQVTATITGHGVKQLVDLTLLGAGSGGGGPPAVLTATTGHPLWTSERGWTRAGDLIPGDHLTDQHGHTTTVTAVARRAAVTTVHNLTVDDRHTYYVTVGGHEALAHNCKARVDGPLPDRGQTSLYALYHEKTGELIKWGTSKNPTRRYTCGCLQSLNARMRILKNFDDPTDARKAEYYLIKRFPGPQNRESVAGSIKPEGSIQDALNVATSQRLFGEPL